MKSKEAVLNSNAEYYKASFDKIKERVGSKFLAQFCALVEPLVIHTQDELLEIDEIKTRVFDQLMELD